MTDTPALTITNLSFTFADAPTPTVRVGAFSLNRGEHALITGPSGCGKSTLLSLIAGLRDPQAGSVRVDGTDVHTLGGSARDAHRGRTIGMIFQTFNLLLGFSARENIEAALLFGGVAPGEHRTRAVELLTRLGIDRHDGDVDSMSVGQQQRIAIARAVACRPPLVLADEPTASLDPDAAREAMTLIRETCASSGAALLCVSHDPAVAPLFERRHVFSSLATGARA